MEQIYTVASLWLTLAVLSAVVAYHLRLSIALVEISQNTMCGDVCEKRVISQQEAPALFP